MHLRDKVGIDRTALLPPNFPVRRRLGTLRSHRFTDRPLCMEQPWSFSGVARGALLLRRKGNNTGHPQFSLGGAAEYCRTIIVNKIYIAGTDR